MDKPSKKAAYSYMEKYNDAQTVVRFATSWATTQQVIEGPKEILKEL